MGNLVVKKEMDLVGYGDDFMDDSGKGFEDTTAASFSIPYIRMVQAGSGAVKKSSEYYIDGAKVGQLLNGLTREVSDTFYMVPVHQEMRFDLKHQETNGKTPLGSYLPSDERVMKALAKCNHDLYHCFDEKGDQFFEASYIKMLHFNIEDGKACNMVPSMVIFDMYSLKTGKELMTRCNMQRGNLFTNVIELGTATKPKDGNEWFIYKYKYLGKIPQVDITNGPELAGRAKDFYENSKNSTVEAVDHGAE